MSEKKPRRLDNIPGNCEFCGKFCKNQNSLRNHERRCEKNPLRDPSKEGGRKKGVVYKQKHLNQFTKAKLLGLEVPKNGNFGKPGTFLGKHHTEEQKRKISEGMKKLTKMVEQDLGSGG